MKIMCVGVTLYLCLVSSLALPGSPKSKDDDKRNLKLLYRFLQFLAAEKGKCTGIISQLKLTHN